MALPGALLVVGRPVMLLTGERVPVAPADNIATPSESGASAMATDLADMTGSMSWSTSFPQATWQD
ncbi:hypothetical protein ACPCHT_32290 [Nucisporomicrobium flavum]|uniref:hypothetical protein n=1 Tax=Nucisporomicrobium flavum TaxID=2785915 RepID=UPI003C3002AF